MHRDRGRHVVIIGAGAVGVISAIEALRDGLRVTLIDPGQPGGEQAASYGNAGWLSSHSVIPPAGPGAWKKVPKYLADPLGPLTVRWQYLPQVLPWLVRYLWSGWTAARLEATAVALRSLLRDAPQLHTRLADEAGVGELVERRGVMHVYPSSADFAADSLAWTIRKRVGIEWLELSRDELRQRQPELNPRYGFGVLVEEAGRCRDPGAYVRALALHARSLGAEFVSVLATGFKIDSGRLKAVVAGSEDITCDKAVVAAGAHSRPLCAALGDNLPLESERGYHVMVENPEVEPRLSFMATDLAIVVNPMKGGLRAAGQVEIAGLEAAPNWRRAEVLSDHLTRMLPNLPRAIPPERIRVWMGHRPSMPDGRPCIGTARATADVVYAFGHGHVGLAGSARTGRLVAQLVAGRETEIPLRPFDPRRYL
jgi:D-amino-acid dehydrogenase